VGLSVGVELGLEEGAGNRKLVRNLASERACYCVMLEVGVGVGKLVGNRQGKGVGAAYA